MKAESTPSRAVNTQRPHMLNVNINSIDEEIFTPDTVQISSGTFRFFEEITDEEAVRVSTILNSTMVMKSSSS